MRSFVVQLMLAVFAMSLSTRAEQADFPLNVDPNVNSLKLATDLEAEVVLENPLVANPLYIHFDARGRLWLVEYRQYPWPAGLRLLSRDAVWRNRYEPPFAPPPPHAEDSPFRGRDRISIHEDTDGDGKYDKASVFLDGLNFATAALPGRGGVYVMNPPYLLYYADQNKDDVPDDPEPRVLLSGFGIEDSHSIANSLRWGPDGWIYATQGSTVSGSVVRHGEDGLPFAGEPPIHSLGQNIWRYHPELHKYEIFAEGGGNAFGVEFDSQGRVYSGHNGGNTRGFHYIQGGYYQKTFGKHGELSNPYAFGYFPAMRHHDVKRFSHTFAIYESNELPDRYHGKLFGVNPVENYLIHSEIEADGSSRKTTDIATVVEAGEGPKAKWFTPVDVQVGPDGALYLADWYSVQANHYRNHEGETNPELGRVIRIQGTVQGHGHDNQRREKLDIEALDSQSLIDRYLAHHNRWHRHQVLRILGDRKDRSLHAKLLSIVRQNDDQAALDALWALNLSEGLSNELLQEFFDHANPSVRAWSVRLWGDRARTGDMLVDHVVQLAKRESNAEVMSQIACTARRLSPETSLPIIAAVLTRDEFSNDIHIPLSLWWAVEAMADRRDLILPLFADPAVWKYNWKPGNSSIGSNLVKRFVMKADQKSLKACAALMQVAPDASRKELSQAFANAVEGRRLPSLPQELEVELAKVSGVFSTVLAMRRGDRSSTETAIESLRTVGTATTVADALKIVGALGDMRALPGRAIPTLFAMFDATKSEELKNATLVSLQKYDELSIGTEILARMGKLPIDVRETAESTLASRATWASQLLDAIESNNLKASGLQLETIEKLRLHSAEPLQSRVRKLFPLTTIDDTELANRSAALLQVINQGQGQPLNGQELFFSKANCGKCHQLFAKGQDIGPDLTPYNRTKIRDMLLAIMRPSAEIREGYENHTAITVDGQVVTGLKVEANDQLVVLRGVDGQSHSIPAEDLEDLSASKQSLMPSGLLDNLTDDEIRDLFAYLVSTTPPK